ncbi:MAG TPA: lytic murein transglycosylase [Oligoflexia bacterium]|nr:lytic murein transglycosylase [Oligoflexia bacterium]HMR24709.1 lytic murein transglycosylase [Oligoflexia bacterium]
MRKLILFTIWAGYLPLSLAKTEYHDVDQTLWQNAVKTVQLELKKKQKKRPYKGHIQDAQIDALTSSQVAFQKVALKFKLMNHIMGAPKGDILKSYVNDVSQKRIKDFLQKHQAAFLASEKKHKVDATGIAGVLYIETAYNASYIQYYPALGSLLTLAALVDEKYRKTVIDQTMQLSKAYSPVKKWQERNAWEERAEKIGQQWLDELAALLFLANQLSWNQQFVYQIKGSWAGAIGYSQFMPATAMQYVKSKNFDFWSWPDSIEFTAKKLSKHHWHHDPRKALLKYNKVSWYGDVIMSIHEKLNPWWKSLSAKPEH